jgi:hypothetical protein
MLKNEVAIDETTDIFIERMGGFADREEAFNFGLWLEMYVARRVSPRLAWYKQCVWHLRYSFDNVGAVFFGKRFEFVEHSIDYGDYIKAVHTAMPLNSFVAMAPLWIRSYLLNIGITIPKVLTAIIAADGIRQTAVRETGIARERTLDTNSKRSDILSQLLSIMQEKKDILTIEEIHVEMWAAVYVCITARNFWAECVRSIAGSDSTSGALRAIFYLLMKHPEKMSKLVRDLDGAFEAGMITHPVQYNQALKVPYLKAVIQEALRLFPPFGVPMPRYAPAEGLLISGYHIPVGSKVDGFYTHVHVNMRLTQVDWYERNGNVIR